MIKTKEFILEILNRVMNVDDIDVSASLNGDQISLHCSFNNNDAVFKVVDGFLWIGKEKFYVPSDVLAELHNHSTNHDGLDYEVIDEFNILRNSCIANDLYGGDVFMKFVTKIFPEQLYPMKVLEIHYAEDKCDNLIFEDEGLSKVITASGKELNVIPRIRNLGNRIASHFLNRYSPPSKCTAKASPFEALCAIEEWKNDTVLDIKRLQRNTYILRTKRGKDSRRSSDVSIASRLFRPII